MSLHDSADNRLDDRFDEPGQPGKFALAELVLDFVDVDTDGFEGEDLLEFFLSDFDVQGYVYTALVEMEGDYTFVRKAENATVGA